MTHDELDRLWFEAMEQSIRDGEQVVRYHFAALVAAAEREACAKICEELEHTYSHTYAHLNCAVLIRERSKT